MKIGIVIPCFNNINVLKHSIKSIYTNEFFFVLYDDNSTDGTEQWVKSNYPKINYLKGNGNNWWTGSVSKGIDFCIKNKCDFVLNLNADAIIKPKTVFELVKTSKKLNNSIVGSVVLGIQDSNKILWAGSLFKKIKPWIPIYASKYFYKNKNYNQISSEIYEVHEVHGRGVLIPCKIFEEIGNYDYHTFPHYGGDTDFSLRAKKNNIKMYINPNCAVKLFEYNTALSRERNISFNKKVLQILKYLFNRKNGEALRVWFYLYWRHLELKYFLQSYCFVILLNIFRRIIK